MERFLFSFFLLGICAIISCSNSGKSSDDNIEDENKPLFVGNPPVIFSEVYSANTDYKDEFGDEPGWVEFYNPADTAVNLQGYSLTNDVNRIYWTFGDVVVEPRSYLTVFLSGRDKPNLSLPSDSINLINAAVGAWTWADSQNEPPDLPGGSTAEHTFSKNAGLSGTLKTTDNSSGLGWSSALIMLKLSGWNTDDIVDISKTNQILLRGNLSKDSKLEIRLAQEGVEDWQAWPKIIKGTGEQNDLYIIELPPSSEFPNLKKIYGLRFSNTSNSFGTINFSFNSIVAQKRGSDVHVPFELSSRGGKLFLMDSILQIRDSVAYPAEVRGLSYAKNFDTEKWAYSKPPTPNSANSNEYYEEQAQLPTTGIPSSGYYESSLSFTLPEQTEQGTIHCDTTGAVPSESSSLKSGVSLNLTKTTVLRCTQFKSGAYPSETVMRTYIIGERLPSLPVVSIAVNPIDMFDSTTGIYATGQNASPNHPYFGANYWADTELPIQIDFFEGNARHAWNNPAGIKIFGNYSRGHAKKSVAIGFKKKYGQKNLRYSLFPEHPSLTKFKWFILRNNGNNFGKDYIRDMLMSSLTEGLGLDYQKGRSVIVYYNGEYFGIHNLRERSNARYFETNYDIDQEFIDLVKGNGEVSRGSDADYQNILQWIGSTTLNDNNLRELEQRIDLDNYTNYLQSEIYFLNTDWPGNNLKRWRSNSPVSKWKWFLFDTDFGFDSFTYENTPNVKMLNFATEPNGPDWPNPPNSTFILRKLFENENYKNAFINRFSILLATYFEPAKVENRINTLMNSISSEISLDQRKWKLNAGTMSSELTKIKNFGRDRPSQMQTEIEEFFDLGASIDITLSVSGNGKILVHNLPISKSSVTFKAYPTVPITLKAEGAGFKGWSDGNTNAERQVTVMQATSLEARF